MWIVLFLSCLLSCAFCLEISNDSYTSASSTFRTDSAPKIEHCDYVKDLFDDGRYLKSACIMNQELNYQQAKQFCAVNKMNLFVMKNEIEASHLMDAAQGMYQGKNMPIWVNGMRATLSKRWEIFSIDERVDGRLNRNIKFYSNHESGNCLRISPKYTNIYGVLPGNCLEKTFFACEHTHRTQRAPELNTKECLYVRHLHNQRSYIKSMCVVNQTLNYDQARRKCAEYKMNLFMFDSDEVDESFFEVSEDILKKYAGGYFWINGLRAPQTNKWFVFYANRTLRGPIYPDFEWVRVNNTNGITSGDCLRLSGQRGPYQGLGVGCDSRSWTICEFSLKN